MSANLVFRAGPNAFEQIRRDGFSAQSIGTIAGASGDAKWLVLSQLDRVIVERLLPQLAGPAHLIGTSIGAWRFACYAQGQPRAAIERFEEAYITQTYSAASHIAHTILVCPSPEFIARLPGGKVTDRTDFKRYPPAERVRIWRRVVAECKALADEFEAVLDRDQMAERLQPLA